MPVPLAPPPIPMALAMAPPASPRLAHPRSVEDLVAALSLHELAYADAKKRVLNEFTEAYVAALLRVTGGNMSEAARRSGLDRSNFRRLVRPKSPTGGGSGPDDD